ncbi:PD-(D/E)XK nuclease family protein [Flavobacteriaceae bacterium]|nr:PD-(D/E)XK nuclease family protein [Flavobacteriaceae bacterium]MDB4289981.1 PD-(D/E)XK nuclease family protein [Flavobacteriaceae bacterium]MDB9873727.1 PD-(D/E)XK nuclease family protein [Flavobacteriaceae bacterium]
MTSFIYDVLKDLETHSKDVSKLSLILPNKRAGIFLKMEWSKLNKITGFLPEIIAIETFIEELSQLRLLSNTELIFEFYEVYLELTPLNERDSFDSFSKWAPIVLQDFNEIDRYLIPQNQIFEYLSAIQEINHWSLEPNSTPLIKGYLSFWKKVQTYYTKFTAHLLQKGEGYQGLIYREAVENLEAYIQNHPEKSHVFLGFNALNASESTIIQELLQQEKAKIYWDIDQTFIETPQHDAGYFIRQHQKTWNHFKFQPFKWVSNYYTKPKNISVVGTPKNIGQVKYVGALLQQLYAENKLQNTALVLGNEDLLIPILNSIPSCIEDINITMGLPLKQIPFSAFIDQWFQLHKDPTPLYYYQDVIGVLSHQFVRPLFQTQDQDAAQLIITTIKHQNLISLSKDQIIAFAPDHKENLELLFVTWNDQPNKAIESVLTLIFKLKDHYTKSKNNHLLALEYLYRFSEIFNHLQRLNVTYSYITSIKVLQSLYKELLSLETLDFKGQPLKGLQIMGMLESRVLDFETVIIVSVNEGVLPAGKTNNSFIPFDVKIENGLPTYKEKDAVYTYHFYRLLQRAKNAHIIYNTEPDVLSGGERSRFITQLEFEAHHNLDHKIVIPETPQITPQLLRVKKTPEIISKLKSVAARGFSPSSLSQYIRNPIDFYNQKILGVKAEILLEETVASNTFGSIIHNTLEAFYKPFIGKVLEPAMLMDLKSKIDATVTYYFKELYKEGDITQGLNLISFEIAKRYVSNFLNYELACINMGDEIIIEAIESKMAVAIDIPELQTPIQLIGTIDRIDVCNGTRRIIDYKTSQVSQSEMELVHWDDITSDYKAHSKSFQIMTYAYMLNTETPFTTPVEAGIVSFKNLKSGLLKFAKKDKPGAYAQKITLLSTDLLVRYEHELKTLILDLFNPDIDIIEKEV